VLAERAVSSSPATAGRPAAPSSSADADDHQAADDTEVVPPGRDRFHSVRGGVV